MGRGKNVSAQVLYGAPRARAQHKQSSVMPMLISSDPSREEWLTGDAAVWHVPNAGPVDVVLTLVNKTSGRADGLIVTEEIEETGEIHQGIALVDLEPRAVASPEALDPALHRDKTFSAGDSVTWHLGPDKQVEAKVLPCNDCPGDRVLLDVTDADNRLRGIRFVDKAHVTWPPHPALAR